MQHIGEHNLFFPETFILIKMLHTPKSKNKKKEREYFSILCVLFLLGVWQLNRIKTDKSVNNNFS